MCNGTTVVNIYKTKDLNYVYIGRGSPFGNPFVIGKDGIREEVIEKYRSYFRGKLEDPAFKAMVLRLRGKRLGCFCKPKACHGDIIKEWLDEDNLSR
ncbi:MAG: DUF4326 domain-containing protein [Bacilli bacterium]